MTSARPTIDVSRLPATAFDSRAPGWWGNTLLMVIETTTVALVIVSYFYLRQSSLEWPPPHPRGPALVAQPAPDLAFGSANTVLLVASCAPLIVGDLAARKLDRRRTMSGLVIGGLMGLA